MLALHLRTSTRALLSAASTRSTGVSMQKLANKLKAVQPSRPLALPPTFFSTASSSSAATAKNITANIDASSLPVFTDAAGAPILLFQPGEDSAKAGRQLVEAQLVDGRNFFVGPIDEQKRLHGAGGQHFGPDGRIRSSGTWVHGVLEGEGEAHFADGASYFGGFVAGKPSGLGTHLYSNGAVYEGQFLNGDRHGLGIRWGVESDDYFAGEWKDGDPVRDCPVPCKLIPKGVRLTPAARKATIMMMADGQYYIGETNAAHEPAGLGMLYAADGTQLAKGTWKDFGCYAVKK